MRSLRLAAFLLTAAALPSFAQGKESGGGAASDKYANPDLGIAFAGVYGWDTLFASGSGAWTELARYSDAAFDAEVLLQVRDNPYKSLAALRKALEEEYKESEAPEAGRAAYKEVAFSDAEMKRGLKLAGIEMEGYATRISEEGKKREYFLKVRTYFGKKRLFRVYCSVRRARAKRVKDRFDIAIASLVVKGATEQVSHGMVLRSERGGYRCHVPEGFQAVLPATGSNTDMRFDSRSLGVAVSIYSYAYDGDLIDHIDEMVDFYGKDITMDDEEAKVLNGLGFRATVRRSGRTTLVVGVVRSDRVYRIHTSAGKDQLEAAKRVHEEFLKEFRIG